MVATSLGDRLTASCDECYEDDAAGDQKAEGDPAPDAVAPMTAGGCDPRNLRCGEPVHGELKTELGHA